jgi:WD40 repeat protein
MRSEHDIHSLAYDFMSVEARLREEEKRIRELKGSGGQKSLEERFKAFKLFIERWSHWLETYPNLLLPLARAESMNSPVRKAALALNQGECGRGGPSFLLLNPEPTDPRPGFRKVLRDHREAVRAVAFSPDGRIAWSCSDDKELRRWDVETWAPQTPLPGHTDGVCAFAIAGDGRRAISVSVDRTVRFWDLTIEHRVLGCRKYAHPFTSLTLNREGTLALSEGENWSIQLWDPASGEILTTLVGHKGPVYAAALCPEGRWALTGGSAGEVLLWDVPAERPAARLLVEADEVRALAVDWERGLAIAGVHPGALVIWNLGHLGLAAASGSLPAAATELEPMAVETVEDGVMSLAMDPQRGQLLFGCVGGQVGLRRYAPWEPGPERTAWFYGHLDRVTAVAVSPDGRFGLTGSEDRSIRYWDLSQPSSRRLPAAPWRSPRVVRPSASGHMIVSGQATGGFDAVRVRDHQPVRLALHDRVHGTGVSLMAVTVTPDGRRAASAGSDGSVRIWDVEQGECLRVLRCRCDENGSSSNGSVRYQVLSLDSAARFCAAIDLRGFVWYWDLGLDPSESRPLRDETSSRPCARCAQPDSGTPTPEEEAIAQLVHVDQPDAGTFGPDEAIAQLVLLDDGRHLVTVSWKGLTRWDMTACPPKLDGRIHLPGVRETRPVHVHGSGDFALLAARAASPHGSDDDFVVDLYELDWVPRGSTAAPGPPTRHFRGHAHAPKALAMSSDGRLIFSAEAEMVLCWDSGVGHDGGHLLARFPIAAGVDDLYPCPDEPDRVVVRDREGRLIDLRIERGRVGAHPRGC